MGKVAAFRLHIAWDFVRKEIQCLRLVLPCIPLRSLVAILLVLKTLGGNAAFGQALPTAVPHGLVVYGTATAADLGVRNDKALGLTAGAYMQSPGLLGLEVRGAIVRWYASYPQYTAVAGFRASPRQGRVSEYAFAGGGMGHARYQLQKTSIAEWGGVLELAGGVEIQVRDTRVSWRAVDISYKRVFVGDGVSSTSGSTGFSLQF